MKKTTVKFGLVALLVTVLYSFNPPATSMSGNSYTDWGSYYIEKSDVTKDFNSHDLETWVITYDKVKSPVYVGVNQTKDCNDYVVNVNGFEVQYKCTKKGFGALKCEDKYSSSSTVITPEMVEEDIVGVYNEYIVPQLVTEAILNEQHLNFQEKICDGQKSPEDCLKIIASYLPQLIKGEV